MKRRASRASPCGQLLSCVRRSSSAWRVTGKNFSRLGAPADASDAAAPCLSELQIPPCPAVPANAMLSPAGRSTCPLLEIFDASTPPQPSAGQDLNQNPTAASTRGGRGDPRLARLWDLSVTQSPQQPRLLVRALNEAVDDPLPPRLFEVDDELIAVDFRHPAVAELLMKNALPRRIASGSARGGHQFAFQSERCARLAAVHALPLLLGALPTGRGIATAEAARRLIKAAGAIGVVAAATAEVALRNGDLDVGRRQLIDKARRCRRLVEAACAPVLGKADLGLPLGPGHADVGQPPFFFEAGGAALIKAALMREQTLLPAWQEHELELEPLGRVQGHQGNAIPGIGGVGVHHQRHMLEEALQTFELVHEAHQFLEVLEPRLRLRALLLLPHLGVTGFIQDQLGELGVAHAVELPAPALEHRQQIGQRAARLARQLLGFDDFAGGLVERDTARAGELRQTPQRAVADAAFGDIDDAFELEVVGRIERDLKVGDRIADLLALVKARTADHAIGQPQGHKPVLEGAHLERGAHQDGDLVETPSRLALALDLLADGARFLLVVPHPADPDPLAHGTVGEQGLAQPRLVVADEMRCRRQDVAGGAVVALEPDHLGARKVELEAQNVVDLRPAPAVDRLVVVADAADIGGIAAGQQPEPQILGDVGVLIFVDQDVAQALPVGREHVGMLTQ